MSAAVYDAVVSIEGGYAPYGGRVRRARAPARVIAGGRGHRGLPHPHHQLPHFAAKLAGDYQTSLALIPDGRAKDQGIAVGEAAAARIVLLRQGDGRDDPSDRLHACPGPRRVEAHASGRWHRSPSCGWASSGRWC